MTLATGVGSMPGDDNRAYAEAVRLTLGELPDLAFVPELPGRGVTADMTGRALAIVDGLGVDLQPAGWRLTDASGIDHRRARSLLAQDLDQVEEQAQDYAGAFKAQVDRTLDAGRDRREAARRQGALRPRRQARPRPGTGRRRARPRRRPASPAARASSG